MKKHPTSCFWHLMFHLQVRLQAQSAYKGILHCVTKTYTHEGVGTISILTACTRYHGVHIWRMCTYLFVMLWLYQLHGFFKGMAFPVLTTGITNSVVFGSYSNALDYLTQSQRSDRSQGKPATAGQVFTAGCFSGLVQVRTPNGWVSEGIYTQMGVQVRAHSEECEVWSEPLQQRRGQRFMTVTSKSNQACCYAQAEV